jgi:hypothetical protein
VLGHEFRPLQRRGIRFEGWNSAKRTTAFLGTFGLVTWAVVACPSPATLALIGGMSSLFKQSRDNEREADQLGFAAATAQGYDPQAGVRIWERCAARKRPTARTGTTPYSPATRKARNASSTSGCRGKHRAWPASTNAEVYRAAMRPFQEKWLASELSRRTYRHHYPGDHGTAAGRTAGNEGALHLLPGRSPSPSQQERRQGQGRRAVFAGPGGPQPPPAAWREQGMLLRDQGDKAGALASLRRYLEIAPGADDAALIKHYAMKLESTP